MKKLYYFFIFFIGFASLLDHGLCIQEKRSLKILMVLGQFPIISQTFIFNQITGLIDRGHDITILARKGRSNEENIHENIITYDLNNKVILHNQTDYNSFDLIMCQFANHGNHVARLKSLGKITTKLVTCFRGGYDTNINAKNLGLYINTFHQSDLILPVSHYFSQKLQSFGCSPKKITVLHSAIDCEKFPLKKTAAPSSGKIKILTTARLAPLKGLEYAIRAVAKYYKKNRNILYTIIGDGGQKKELQKLISDLDANNYITLVGPKISDQISAYLT